MIYFAIAFAIAQTVIAQDVPEVPVSVLAEKVVTEPADTVPLDEIGEAEDEINSITTSTTLGPEVKPSRYTATNKIANDVLKDYIPFECSDSTAGFSIQGDHGDDVPDWPTQALMGQFYVQVNGNREMITYDYIGIQPNKGGVIDKSDGENTNLTALAYDPQANFYVAMHSIYQELVVFDKKGRTANFTVEGRENETVAKSGGTIMIVETGTPAPIVTTTPSTISSASKPKGGEVAKYFYIQTLSKEGHPNRLSQSILATYLDWEGGTPFQTERWGVAVPNPPNSGDDRITLRDLAATSENRMFAVGVGIITGKSYLMEYILDVQQMGPGNIMRNFSMTKIVQLQSNVVAISAHLEALHLFVNQPGIHSASSYSASDTTAEPVKSYIGGVEELPLYKFDDTKEGEIVTTAVAISAGGSTCNAFNDPNIEASCYNWLYPQWYVAAASCLIPGGTTPAPSSELPFISSVLLTMVVSLFL